jgi:serine/threonine-protein kinase RsbW
MRAAAPRATGALLRLRCRATPEHLPGLLRQVDDALRLGGADADAAHDLRLVIEEACVNVMRHAWKGFEVPGELSLEIQSTRLGSDPALKIEVSDHGVAFNPLAAETPDLLMPAQERPIGGLGIHLIRSLTDEQHYSRDAVHGNRLILIKRVVGALAP